MRRPHPRALAALALSVTIPLTTLTACSSDDPNSVKAQAKEGSGKNYIQGSGAIEQVPSGKRGEALALSGPTIDGTTWSLKEHDGEVVVVNVWGSWCPPCVKETPELKKAHAALKGKNVTFVGVNVKEAPASGQAFAAAQGIPYPSLAYDGGKPLLQLKGRAQSFPTTLILDERGRIAVRVNGEVTSATLTGLVDDVIAQKG